MRTSTTDTIIHELNKRKMKHWKVMYHGFCEYVKADTKEEAKQKAIDVHNWWAGERLTVKEDKSLYGWDLIDSLGASKYD